MFTPLGQDRSSSIQKQKIANAKEGHQHFKIIRSNAFKQIARRTRPDAGGGTSALRFDVTIPAQTNDEAVG